LAAQNPLRYTAFETAILTDMPDLNYKITTTAELAGAQATEAALERQIGKAKALKQDYSELQKQHDLVTQSIREAKVPQEQQTEQFERATINARGLHGALHLIARESGPAMGAAVAGAAALMTGGLYTAVFAVRELFAWIEGCRKKAEDFREQQAELWISIQKGASDAAKTESDFSDQLDKVKTKTNEVKTAFATESAILAARIKQHEELLKAIEKEQLAEAKGDPKKEAAIKAKFDALREEFNIVAARVKLEQQEAELYKLSLQGRDLASTATGAKNAVEAAQRENERHQAELKNAGDESKLRAAAVEAAKLSGASVAAGAKPITATSSVEDLITNRNYLQNIVNRMTAAGEASQAAGLQKRVDAISDFVKFEAVKKEAETSEAILSNLNKKLQEAVTARDANTQAVNAETEKINIGLRTLKIQEQTTGMEKTIAAGGKVKMPGLNEPVPLPVPEAAPASARIPFERTPEGIGRRDFEQEQGYADVLAAGGKLNEAQNASFHAIADAMLGHHASQLELNSLIDELHSTLVTNQEDINKKFANLVQTIKDVSGRVAHNQLL
jgi:hypothetical protein